MALRVYGVVLQDGQGAPKLPAGTVAHGMRELAAIAEATDSPAGGRNSDTPEIERHLGVVEELFAQDAVLPTPVGTTFDSADVLQRWMELHYVALSDALAWVENRVGARVHITRAMASERDAGSDLAAIGAEIVKTLRRHAVSSVPLRNEAVTGIVLTAAYLVERELWDEFKDAVEDARERHPLVKVELTGPWPPYDFVRLQFGS